MKLGVLYSGGKDSNLAMWISYKAGYEISCLISIMSENENSFMFHTPSIDKVKLQAEVLGIPLIIVKTKGEKEKELFDLEFAIKKAILDYGISGVVTGAVESVYQTSRVQKICNKLDIECFNPLWQKNQIEILEDLINEGFEVVVVGVFAYPFDKSWLGRRINFDFVSELKSLREKYGISPSGEGGEYESFVLNSPLFKSSLDVVGFKDIGEKNSWRRELEVGVK